MRKYIFELSVENGKECHIHFGMLYDEHDDGTDDDGDVFSIRFSIDLMHSHSWQVHLNRNCVLKSM